MKVTLKPEELDFDLIEVIEIRFDNDYVMVEDREGTVTKLRFEEIDTVTDEYLKELGD